MLNKLNPQTALNQPTVYQIGLQGHLGLQWHSWFEEMNITHEGKDTTFLTGPVADQAALHGLLRKVCNLGIPLLSVNSVDRNQVNSANVNFEFNI